MKAVWYNRPGDAAEVLQYGEQPTPVPAPGEVRVRLRASAVNPADANRRAGRLHAMEFPRVIPHSDGAGVIDAVGAGVDPGRMGQRVWLYFGQRGRPFGTAAEYICVPQALTAPLPDWIDDAEGACLGIPCMTAWCALFMDGAVAGQVVLVTGGAGAVGHYAVQLACWGGATVVATVSSQAKAEHAWRAGAHAVVDYTRADAAQAVLAATKGRAVDRIVDVDAVANAELVLDCAADAAVWVSYAVGADATASLPMARVIRRNLRLQGLYLSGLPAAARREAQQGVQRWLADSRDTAIHAVYRRYPLSQTVQAHLAVEAKNKLGTVVVMCDAQEPHTGARTAAE